MVEYGMVNVKLSDTQLKKLKDAVKDNTGTTFRINLKMLHGYNLPHELFWQQDKKQSQEMLLIIICQLI